MFLRLTFTFHYVSIKSEITILNLLLKKKFTFHYVSIKSGKTETWKSYISNLHSTMYLLNRRQGSASLVIDADLHSTMYLLNLHLIYLILVKIKHLHSTMYLLNPKQRTTARGGERDLHSTMYLLNQIYSSRFLECNNIYIPLCIY